MSATAIGMVMSAAGTAIEVGIVMTMTGTVIETGGGAAVRFWVRQRPSMWRPLSITCLHLPITTTHPTATERHEFCAAPVLRRRHVNKPGRV